MAVSTAWFPRVLTSWRGRAAVAAVIGAVALASAASAAVAGTTAKDAAQRVIATVRVGDGPSALAVNPRTGAVYVVNQGSRTVTVISGQTSKVATTVPIKESSTLSPCAVTVSPVTGDVYVSNCKKSVDSVKPLVTVLNGRTNKVTAVITVDQPASNPEDGTYPENITVSPVTGEVYVFSTGYKQPTALKVLDGRTNKIITTVPGVGGLGSACGQPTDGHGVRL